jgi:hypothetical protein
VTLNLRSECVIRINLISAEESFDQLSVGELFSTFFGIVPPDVFRSNVGHISVSNVLWLSQTTTVPLATLTLRGGPLAISVIS